MEERVEKRKGEGEEGGGGGDLVLLQLFAMEEERKEGKGGYDGRKGERKDGRKAGRQEVGGTNE